MAQILQQTYVITLSKLVKDNQLEDPVCPDDVSEALKEALCGVAEQLLDDASVLVEVTDHNG